MDIQKHWVCSLNTSIYLSSRSISGTSSITKKTPTQMSSEWMSSLMPAHIFHPHSVSKSIMPLATFLELVVCTVNISMRHPPGSAEMHDTTASSSRRMQMRSDSMHWVLPKFKPSFHSTTTLPSTHALLCGGSRPSEMHHVLILVCG